MKSEAIRLHETLLRLYQSTRRHLPEDSNLDTHHTCNLKSHYILSR